MTEITREEIRLIKQLQKSAKTRKEENSYVVEGLRSVSEIPKEDIRSVYVAKKMDTEISDKDRTLIPSGYTVVKDSILEEMADTKNPQGVLAVVSKHRYTAEDVLKKSEHPLLVLLENLQDPGNLGTILRTAEGAGVNGLLLCGDTVDIYNPKVVRASMGAIHRVPFLLFEETKDAISWVKERGILCYAAHLNGEDFYREDLTKGICFMIGNEGNGLTDETAKAADRKIKIPMKGQVESLNAAAATTILCYETLRQREYK